jgi:Tfp pilus assembly protein PilF
MSKRKQPQRLPPPITHGGETIDSEVVLNEFPGELGLLFWKTVRAVRLWAEVPEGERTQTFTAEAHARRLERLAAGDIPEEIRTPLTRAAAVLQPRARAATVASACRDLSDWAAGRGCLGTGLEFMQAAAILLPRNAEVAREGARLAKRNTEYTRAETWYRQAISRARIGRSWYDFSRAYIGLGTVFMHRGNFPQAKKSLIRGLRAARRFSIRSLAAAAYHELSVVAIRTDRLDEATRYARSALQAYRSGHRRLPALAHDYGVHLMKAGYFDAALRTFLACPADYGAPVDRLSRAAAIARAAGSVGDSATFEDAHRTAVTLLEEPTAQAAATAALLAIARGAASIGELELASRYGTAAQTSATARGEFALQHEADAFVDSLGAIEMAPAPNGEPLQPVPENVAGAVAEFELALSSGQAA